MKSYDKYEWMFTPPEEKQRIKEENRLNAYLDFAQENDKNPEDPRTFYEYVGKSWHSPRFLPLVLETHEILRKNGFTLPLDQEKLKGLAKWIEEYNRRRDELLKLKSKIDNEIAEAVGIKNNQEAESSF